MEQELSLAAQVEIANTNQKIDQMSLDQLRDFAKLLFRNFKIHEVAWRELIAHQWGLKRIQLDENAEDHGATK